MTYRVVGGFDGSPGAAAALAWAAEEARLHDGELVALAVLNDHQPPAPVPTPLSVDDPDGLVGRLHRAVAEISSDAAFRYDHGGAATQLSAAGNDADLLVVGSRGRNPLAGLLLGSVSRGCLHHASCPVAVVRTWPPPTPPRGRVIVGIDGSDQARQALHVAAEEARLQGAAVHAIHAVHWDHLGAELVAPATRQLVGWWKDLVAAELARTKVVACPVILNGHAPDVLVRHSNRADLLVLGARGRNPLASLLLGSTSEHCARHTQSPPSSWSRSSPWSTVERLDVVTGVPAVAGG
jgi:nucleotide-binding universal stress UspA family protein